MGSYDRRVVLGAEPCPTVVCGDGGDIIEPLPEGLELSFVVEELSCHVGAHLVDLESREDLVGVAKRSEEVVGE